MFPRLDCSNPTNLDCQLERPLRHAAAVKTVVVAARQCWETRRRCTHNYHQPPTGTNTSIRLLKCLGGAFSGGRCRRAASHRRPQSSCPHRWTKNALLDQNYVRAINWKLRYGTLRNEYLRRNHRQYVYCSYCHIHTCLEKLSHWKFTMRYLHTIPSLHKKYIKITWKRPEHLEIEE